MFDTFHLSSLSNVESSLWLFLKNRLGPQTHHHENLITTQIQVQLQPLSSATSASWPKCKPLCLPCSCTDLLPLSLAGPHSPHANTQLSTDKATLLGLSQPVPLAKCVNHSLSVPPLPRFWTCLHDSILSFYLSPIPPHPIRHSASIAPREEEDGPSCCAQVCLSEVTVCMCVFERFHEGMKKRKGASENTITEQVSFHLCRSQLTFPSLSLSPSVTHILYWCIYTGTLATKVQKKE